MQYHASETKSVPCPICGGLTHAELRRHSDLLAADDVPAECFDLCWKCSGIVHLSVEYYCGGPPMSRDRAKYEKKPIPEPLRWQVFERDGFACRGCGTRQMLRADHVVAERRGGLATLENLQTLCRSCNSKKGAR